MGATTVKSKRLEARVTAQQRELIQRAADVSGRSLTDFIVSSLQIAAEETLRAYQVIELTQRDTEAFVNSLLNPPAPNESLRAAARRYRELTGE
ncbi:MAG: DUF1778 domain-containing protein [Dehalococcoidia bacterium]|nr:DUF1778 domain-containing protein [Dehalococcoidia bacterium]